LLRESTQIIASLKGEVMTLSTRIRCFVEMGIMMLALAAPSFAQISAHGYISDCDQTKATPDYANDLKSIWSRWDSLLPPASTLKSSPGKSTPRNSLAKYCIAEFLLEKRAYQASVNAYRDSLARDGNPVWTRAWSHLQIGKIFDITSQRERAVAQYQLAIGTGDNTDGAINQARQLLEHPFEWPVNQ
jgi:tetratricopeptide (TPR) repeat protein